MELFHRMTDWITGSYTDSLATQKALHCRDHVLALVARPPIYMNADQLCGYIRARASIVVRETFSGHIPLFVNQSRLLEKTIEKSVLLALEDIATDRHASSQPQHCILPYDSRAA